jgi:ATP-dependent DNA ligase
VGATPQKLFPRDATSKATAPHAPRAGAVLLTPISAALSYLTGMLRKVEYQPCIPTRGTKVPAGPDWIHEIKHDGYRLIVQREGKHSATMALPPGKLCDPRESERGGARCANRK